METSPCNDRNHHHHYRCYCGWYHSSTIESTCSSTADGHFWWWDDRKSNTTENMVDIGGCDVRSDTFDMNFVCNVLRYIYIHIQLNKQLIWLLLTMRELQGDRSQKRQKCRVYRILFWDCKPTNGGYELWRSMNHQ